MVLAVVPARGGSKGVPLKNIRPLLGIPLVAMVGEIIRELPEIDRAVVSTDHEEIARVAIAAGLEAPFRRPQSLSGDLIGDFDVLVHALNECERFYEQMFDVVTMLQPTSPLRHASHVLACLEKLVAEELDAVWTVSPTDLKYHPLKQLVIDDRGRVRLFDRRSGTTVIARQQLTPVYHRNGAAYALSRNCLLEQKTIMGRRWGAVIIEDPMVSIDTWEDFERVEKILASSKLAKGQ